MIPFNQKTPLILLDQQGNFHRLSLQVDPLGPRSDIVSMMAEQVPHTFPSFTTIDGLPVHLCLQGKEMKMAVELPYLRVRTYYMARGTGKELCLVPWFESLDAIEYANDWPVPKDCRLFFVAHQMKCYLVALRKQTDRTTIHRLPMPNIYDHAEICMGNFKDEKDRSPYFNSVMFLREALVHFSSSIWNTDLSGKERRSYLAEFMRFDMNGQPLPPRQEWHNYSPVISGESFNWVAML